MSALVFTLKQRAEQWTGATLLASVVGERGKAQQDEHLGDRDSSPYCGEVDGRA